MKFQYETIFSSKYSEYEKAPVMVIGIWYGESKPILNEYLSRLVEDLENVISRGVSIKDYQVSIKFGRVHSDTPARSFIKGRFFGTYARQSLHLAPLKNTDIFLL